MLEALFPLLAGDDVNVPIRTNQLVENHQFRQTVHSRPIVKNTLIRLNVMICPFCHFSLFVPILDVLPSSTPLVIFKVLTRRHDDLVVCLKVHRKRFEMIFMEEGISLKALILGK